MRAVAEILLILQNTFLLLNAQFNHFEWQSGWIKRLIWKRSSQRIFNHFQCTQDQVMTVTNKKTLWFETAAKEMQPAVPTAQIIVSLLSMESTCKTFTHWLYPFLAKSKLSCKMADKASQKLREILLSICENFIKSIREISMWMIVEKTFAFYGHKYVWNSSNFEPKLKSNNQCGKDKTESVRCSESNSRRAAICVSIAPDWTRLPVFITCKDWKDWNCLKQVLFQTTHDRFSARSINAWAKYENYE